MSESPRPQTLCEAFQRTAAIDPDAVALRTVGGAVEVTWGRYAERVRSIAAALAGLGVGRGDTVALMLVNRPEFHLVDVAALHLGACPFSIYNSSSPEQIEHLFANAATKVVISEAAFAARLLEAGAGCVVTVDDAPGTHSLAELEAGAAPIDFDATWRAVQPTDLATLIYTSGTTGPSKGVEITHEQALAQVWAVTEWLPIRFGDTSVSFLPSAHIAERGVMHYTQLAHGSTLTCVADPRQVALALPEVRPDYWGAVPSVWQRIRGALELGLTAQPEPVRKAVAAAVAAQEATRRGEEVPAELAAAVDAAAPVLGALRAKIGMDRVRWAVCGAAAVPAETLVFFGALGIEIYECWGMSEVSGIGISNAPGHRKIGSVGRAVPGTEVRLAEDGELLFRGRQNMTGYRALAEATAEAIDADGWLHTGDVATIDEDGYVSIVDRKKELIINEAGKNMSPANIELTVKAAAPLIGNVVAIGDARPYVTALIVLEADAAAAWAKDNGRPDASAAALAADPAVRETLESSVRAANLRLSRVEQIKRFRILDAFWAPASEELTPTMKLRRKPIAARYAAQIEDLYAPDPSPSVIDLR
ncbi:MAG: AMP-binding protein [Sporichthyaceae bacterium]